MTSTTRIIHTDGGPPPACPECESVLDAATINEDGAVPSPGDWSVCFECGAILRFTDDLRMRLAEDTDLASTDDETREHLTRAQAYVRLRKN